MKKSSTRPHSPPTLAPVTGRLTSTHSPPPLCNRAGRLCVCVPAKASESKNEKRGEWPPREYALPATVEAIEAGRQSQGVLFIEAVDDSRTGRLARLMGRVL